jgi:hypothetical protein
MYANCRCDLRTGAECKYHWEIRVRIPAGDSIFGTADDYLERALSEPDLPGETRDRFQAELERVRSAASTQVRRGNRER